MRILPLLLAGALLAASLTPARAGAGSEATSAMRVLRKGTDGRQSANDAGRRRAPWIEVAADERTYKAIWSRELPGKPDTSIDFPAETAIFLLLGTQTTGGYAIEPISVELGDGSVRVHAKLVQPMTENEATDGICVPFAALAVASRGATKIEWLDADGRLLATKTIGE